jgi:flagellar basal-body rod protein FlgF
MSSAIRWVSDDATNSGEYVVSHTCKKIRGKKFAPVWPPTCSPTRTRPMDQSDVLAAGGLRARMEALDMLSNNLANANTTGFKLDREFYSLFTGDGQGADGQEAAQLPNVKSHWTDFSQGTLTVTKNPLDLALTGQGFFVVNGPSGPLYTRNGSFQLSNTGLLVTSDGYPVSGTSGPIQTMSNATIEIQPDGTVQQDGQTIGQLKIANFTDPRVLSKMGNSYFVNSNPSVQPVASTAVVAQGQLEGSNVQLSEAAVGLVGVMRQSEMLQKAILTTAEMNKQALQEVARVGGGV